MRTWVEKLARVSKERGSFFCMRILIDDLEWDIDSYYRDTHFTKGGSCLCIKHIENESCVQNCWIKLYDDELDLLKETMEYCENKAKDYFLNRLENLE